MTDNSTERLKKLDQGWGDKYCGRCYKLQRRSNLQDLRMVHGAGDIKLFITELSSSSRKSTKSTLLTPMCLCHQAV